MNSCRNLEKNLDEKIILSSMGQNGKEAIGSMGTDTPIAALS